MSDAGLAALVVGILRLLIELFFPPTKETARAVSDPAALDPAVLARPERLHPLGRGP
jgi:hypothetical protein